MIQDRWFVGQTRAGLGPWAEKNLAAQGILHYTPRIVTPEGPTENLFPRYLFVRLEPTQRNFSRVNSTRGMNKLLPLLCEVPLPVPDSYVADLMQRVGAMGTIDDAEEVTYDYVSEEQIRVVSGNGAGQVGTYQYRKKGLAVLLMLVMGRQTRVTVPLHCTERLLLEPVMAEAGAACH